MPSKNKKYDDMDINVLNAIEKNQEIYDMLKNAPKLSKKNLKKAKKWVVDLAKLMMS